MDDFVSYFTGGWIAIAFGFMLFPVHMIAYSFFCVIVGHWLARERRH